MILAIDVHYREEIARVVSIEFEDWNAIVPTTIHVKEIPETPPYVPGQFYKRELPCIMEILKCSDLSNIKAIIVDGYVVLDDLGKKGLGGYLYDHLNQAIPVIGVAKKRFHSLDKLTLPIFRGASKKPLYVTCLGGELAEYAQKVQDMQGDYRFPELLKILDMETKRKSENK